MSRKLKKLSIITLGCQMNKHDSEWISGALADDYEYTDKTAEADFLVVNTCAVRDKAEQKFFSILGRLRPLKEAKADMVVAIAGCVAQELAEEIARREPFVDIILGTRAIGKTPELLQRFLETGVRQIDVGDDSNYDQFPMRRESAFMAWTSIMRGCDNHCSYCIVPMVRGAEQSRPMDSILEEIRGLVEDGYKEITLIGQNVNSYGRGLEPEVDFPRLLRRIDSIDGIGRVRFLTSHPKDLSDRLIMAMANLTSVCPSLHLPIQSGSDRILKLMNRGYTAQHYFDRVDKLKERVKDIAITADVIVGFPGETDEEFAMTYDAIEKARYNNIYLFKYSPRPGTKAAELDEQVEPEIVTQRFLKILARQQAIGREKNALWVNREVEILVEGASRRNAHRYSGRTPQNITVNFHADKDITGQIIRVTIVQSKQYSLEGSIIT